jgi:hypothetical protein
MQTVQLKEVQVDRISEEASSLLLLAQLNLILAAVHEFLELRYY